VARGSLAAGAVAYAGGMRPRWIGPVLALACVAAKCNGDPPATKETTAKPPPPASSSAASTGAASAASAATSASPDAAAGPIDLLWATPSVVAVSSRVANPRDFPEHLVDHRPETAWNGKTGDLVGGWIAFEVPKDATISHVLLTAGFDKISASKEDLFTANHRITKVRLSQGKRVIREVALDPSVRAPQRIEVGAAGGEYRLEILAVQPGSKATWRELTVSELAVIGTPGKTSHKKPVAPLVRVGSLAGDLRAVSVVAEGATREAACAALLKDENEALDEGKSEPWWQGETPETPSCTPGAAVLAPGGPIEVFTVHVETIAPGPYHVRFSGELLAFRTPKRVWITSARVSGDETAWFWKIHYDRLAAEWVDGPKGKRLAIQVSEGRVTDSDGYAEDPRDLHSEALSHVGVGCDVAPAPPTCLAEETRLADSVAKKLTRGAVKIGDDGEARFAVTPP